MKMLSLKKTWGLYPISILILVVLLLLNGCGTTGKRTDVDVDITYNITSTGDVIIKPALDQKSITGDIEDLTTDNRPNVPVDLKLTSPADILSQSIVETVNKKIIKTAEEIVEPAPILADDDISGLETSWTYQMKYNEDHGRLFLWLPQTGSHYGGPITLSIPECDATLTVPNAAENHKTQSIIYFCGTKNKEAEANGIRASAFGPPGCKAGSLHIVKR